MPSYYDSTKKKPGKAKVKYNEGGKVKKMKEGGPASVFLEEIVITAKKGPQRGKGAGSGKSGGGSRGRTIARGSGAARPQTFHKNG